MATFRSNLNGVPSSFGFSVIKKRITTCFQQLKNFHKVQKNTKFLNNEERSFVCNIKGYKKKFKKFLKSTKKRKKVPYNFSNRKNCENLPDVGELLSSTVISATASTTTTKNITSTSTATTTTTNNVVNYATPKKFLASLITQNSQLTMAADDFLQIRTDFPEINSDIRAILMSHAKTGATISEIRADYYKMTGVRLPVYENIVEFLLSIPEVSAFCQPHGTLIFHVVPNEKTEHLYQLITEQRYQTSTNGPVAMRVGVSNYKNNNNNNNKYIKGNISSGSNVNHANIWRYCNRNLDVDFQLNDKNNNNNLISDCHYNNQYNKANNYISNDNNDKSGSISNESSNWTTDDANIGSNRNNHKNSGDVTHESNYWTTDNANIGSNQNNHKNSGDVTHESNYWTTGEPNIDINNNNNYADKFINESENWSTNDANIDINNNSNNNYKNNDNINNNNNNSINNVDMEKQQHREQHFELLNSIRNQNTIHKIHYNDNYNKNNHNQRVPDIQFIHLKKLKRPRLNSTGEGEISNKRNCNPPNGLIENNSCFQDNCNYLLNRLLNHHQADMPNNTPVGNFCKKYKLMLENFKNLNINCQNSTDLYYTKNSLKHKFSDEFQIQEDTSLRSSYVTNSCDEPRYTINSNHEAHLLDFPLLGDDFLMYMARMELKCKFKRFDKVLQSGLCVSGQTIRAAISRVRALNRCSMIRRVIVNIGSVDIIKGRPLIKIEHDFLQLKELMIKKNIRPIFTTLAPLANYTYCEETKQKLERFNEFIKRESRYLQCIDIWSCFVKENKRTLFECYQMSPRNVTGTTEPHVFWNKIGRQRVLQKIQTELEY